MQKRKVLVCGGEAMLRHGLKAFIPWDDYGIRQVLQAASAQEALDKFVAVVPEIVIVDANMPDMDGIALIEAMRRANNQCAFLLMGESRDLENACSQVGVYDFLVKPVSPDMMRLAIARNVALQEMRGDIRQQLENAQTMLTKVRPLLIQNLALEITRGTFEPGKGLLNKRFSELGIFFDFEQYICFVSTIVAPKMEKVEESVFFEVIRNRIFERFPIRTDVTIADSLTMSDDSHISIIIGFDQEENLGAIEEYVSSAFLSMEKIFGLPYVLVISRLTNSLYDIRKLYQSTKKICDYLKFTKQYGIHRASAFRQPDAYQFVISQEQRAALSRHLLKNDIAGLRRDLVAIKQSALKMPIKDTGFLFLSTLEIMMTGAQFLRDQGKKIENVYAMDVFTQDFFDSFEDIDALFFWLEQYFLTICNMCCNTEETSGNNNTVARIKDYIQENYGQPLSLKGVAQVMYYNPNYLGRMFNKHEDRKFSNYIHDVRICEAMKLLETSEASLPEVAEAVGYRDASYFFKIFKKITGMTPMNYKNRHR